MTKANHTPGPWVIKQTTENVIFPPRMTYLRAGPAIVASVMAGYEELITHESAANARLIAAAPELLYSVEELLEHIEWRRRIAGETAGPDDCTHRARAAIAKATGGAS